MSLISQRVIEVLGPYVGDTVADTCVRASALSLGKTTDELTAADFPALEANVRRLLGPMAPSDVIDRLLADIERGIS